MRHPDPEPPHISASVYSEGLSERGVFRAIYSIVVDELQAVPRYLDAVPLERSFESISDLANQTVRTERGEEFPSVLRGEQRVIRAYLSAPKVGAVVLKYESARPSDRHPIGALWSAGALSIPLELLKGSEKRRAFRLGQRSLGVFKAMCSRVDPLYGHLAIEDTLPSPMALTETGRVLNGEAYLSDRLVNGDDGWLRYLRNVYSESVASKWEYGWFISGWAPFSESGLSLANLSELRIEVTSFVASRMSR